MTGVGDTPRSFDELVRYTNKRLVALERQLVRRTTVSASSGGGGGGGTSPHTHVHTDITDWDTAVPASVPVATDAVEGKIELATAAEVAAGTDASRAVTPATLAPLLVGVTVPPASETVAGRVELATAAETTAGVDNTRAVHPAGLKVELDKKAPLASPALTGTPTTPTATAGTNTTQIASTAFVTGAVATAVTGLAPLASPAFTGNPTAPTPTAGDNDTSVATTAFVTTAVANGVASVPVASETVQGKVELATAAETTAGVDNTRAVHPAGLKVELDKKAPLVHTHAQSDITNLVSDLALKAPLASPALTGTPTAPTATAGTSTTQIATTAFVGAAVAAGVASVPVASETVQGKVELATAAETTAGVDNTRAVHPAGLKVELDKKAPLVHTHAQSDVTNLVSDLALKAPLASPALTGTPTTPTAAPGTSTTQIASTAFVAAAVTAAAVPDATETVKGKVELATTAEAAAGASTTLVVTPAGLAAGITALVPAAVPVASETVQGKVELATAAETTTGTDATRAVHPAGLKVELDKKAPLSHTHTKSQITDFAHTHPQSEVTNLVSDLALKAPLASPALTGTPTAPTATAGTNTTQIATTAFVAAAVAAIPGVADATTTSKGVIQLAGDLGGTAAAPTVIAASETVAGKVELATAAETTTGTDNTRAVHPAGLRVELLKKANLASPALTGVPTAPTAANGANSTQIATTAYVDTAVTTALTFLPYATETTPGQIRLATQAEVTAGVDAVEAVTSATLKVELDKKAPLSHTHTSSQITDFATAVPAAVPVATETVQGKVELATMAEAVAGTDATRAVTPQGLGFAIGQAVDGYIPEGAFGSTGALLAGGFASAAYYSLPIGANGQVLTVDTSLNGRLKWATPAGGSTAASETVAGIVELATAAETTTGTDNTRAVHPLGLKAATDLLVPKSQYTAKGMIVVGTGGVGNIGGFGSGPNDWMLVSDSTAAGGLKWKALDAVPQSSFDAKGDLIAGTADNLSQRLPVGTNGQVLVADSTQPTGLKWAAGGGSSLPALPPPSRFDRTQDTNAITATATWGDTIPGVAASITTDRPLWVLVTFGAWMGATAGDTRAGVRLSGATVCDPATAQPEWGAADTLWGQTLIITSADAATGTGQRTMQRLYYLNAGTTNFVPVAYMSSTGTHNVNYPVLEVTPIAYVDTPVAVTPTVGVLTRRESTSGAAVATTATSVDWNVAVADSGHFTFNATADDFTCVVPGTYQITAQVGSTSVASENSMRIQVSVNGTVISEPVVRRLTASGTTGVAVTTKALAVGDKVLVQILGGSANGTVDATTGRTYIELVPVVTKEGSSAPTDVIQGFVVGSNLSTPIGTASTLPNFPASANYADGITWDGTNDRFVIIEPGWYEIQGNITIQPGSVGLPNVLLGQMRVNTNTLAETIQRMWPTADAVVGFNLMTQRQLVAGDYVDIVSARSSAMTAATILHASLSVRKIR